MIYKTKFMKTSPKVARPKGKFNNKKTSTVVQKIYRIVRKFTANLEGPSERENPISGEMTEGSNQDLLDEVFRLSPYQHTLTSYNNTITLFSKAV